MDCNSYSYAPYMLDAPRQIVEQYSDDDMVAEIEQAGSDCFVVWAFSYSGDFDDCYEEFSIREAAEQLYSFILSNRASGGDIEQFIDILRRRAA